MRQLLEIVPEAKGVRGHSFIRSTRLSAMYLAAGLRYESDVHVPLEAWPAPAPWHDLAGMIQVPFVWGDNVFLTGAQEVPIARMMSGPGLRVFNFHPIHVFLNTDTMERYRAAHPATKTAKELASLRADGFGVGRVLEEFLDGLRGADFPARHTEVGR